MVANISSSKNNEFYKSFSHKLQEQDTEIFLIRHGRTEWNDIGKYQGQQDSDLNIEGINGAIMVGEKLSMVHRDIRPFSHCYVSPLGRTQHTASLILKQFINNNNTNSNTNSNSDTSTIPKNKDNLLNISKLNSILPFGVSLDARIMERHFGDFQGKNHPQLAKEYPQESKLIGKGGEPIDWKPPSIKQKGSESLRDLINRSNDFLNDISTKHRGQRILVIAHGGVINAMFKSVLDRIEKERVYYIRNCAINILLREAKNGKWFVSLLGDDGMKHRYNWINVKTDTNDDDDDDDDGYVMTAQGKRRIYIKKRDFGLGLGIRWIFFLAGVVGGMYLQKYLLD